MGHVILIGDSTFDNSAYVAGGDDVVRHLRARLPAGWRATLRAVDGALIGSVARQLAAVPDDATHLVVSIGGNNALGHLGVLDDKANSVAMALTRLAEIREGFEAEYGSMLAAVLARGLPTALCTIYHPRFPEAHLQRLGVTGLTMFNDSILQHAFARALPVLDLRLICSEDRDYANAIEPSVQGGEKIATAIAGWIARHDLRPARSEIFTR
jgi:hypothetical protein